jgi:hypothetical protein
MNAVCSVETGKSYRQRLPPGEGLGAAAPEGFPCAIRYFQLLDNNMKEL